MSSIVCNGVDGDGSTMCREPATQGLVLDGVDTGVRMCGRHAREVVLADNSYMSAKVGPDLDHFTKSSR